ncbi:MAG: GAF domain-containing protein [Bacteroidales bacterium]|nr:GAF domain-containing protein [Bacteroidales bacterium]
MEKEKKTGRYIRVYEQLEGLLTKTPDIIARMATVCALLHAKIDYFFWCGFYRIIDGQLTVGPYQGPLACQILTKDKGVCWAAVNQNKTLIVPDVHKFPGHIACDSRSNSEIVLPLRNRDGQIIAVFDVDSTEFNAFDEIDAFYLEKIVLLIQND